MAKEKDVDGAGSGSPLGCVGGVEAARVALLARGAGMRQHAEAVHRGTVNGIHDMRVASRRLRKALSEYGPLLEEAALEAFRERVRIVTESLGRPRELDVMLSMLSAERGETGGSTRTALNAVMRVLKVRRKAAVEQCQRVAQSVGAPAFDEELRCLAEGLRAPEICHIRSARRRLFRQYKRLGRRYERWNAGGGDAGLHGLRIGFKKLRYGCELYAPLYGKPFHRFLGRLKAIQDVLGEWQDCRVLLDEMSGVFPDAPMRAQAGAAGLCRIFEERRRVLRGRAKRRLARFFSKPSRRAVKRLMKQPVAECSCGGPRQEGESAADS